MESSIFLRLSCSSYHASFVLFSCGAIAFALARRLPLPNSCARIEYFPFRDHPPSRDPSNGERISSPARIVSLLLTGLPCNRGQPANAVQSHPKYGWQKMHTPVFAPEVGGIESSSDIANNCIALCVQHRFPEIYRFCPFLNDVPFDPKQRTREKVFVPTAWANMGLASPPRGCRLHISLHASPSISDVWLDAFRPLLDNAYPRVSLFSSMDDLSTVGACTTAQDGLVLHVPRVALVGKREKGSDPKIQVGSFGIVDGAPHHWGPTLSFPLTNGLYVRWTARTERPWSPYRGMLPIVDMSPRSPPSTRRRGVERIRTEESDCQ